MHTRGCDRRHGPGDEYRLGLRREGTRQTSLHEGARHREQVCECDSQQSTAGQGVLRRTGIRAPQVS